jgi:hypothetical protein
MDRDTNLDSTALTLSTPAPEPLQLVPPCVPANDLAEFHRLQEKNQARVRALIQAMHLISGSVTIKAGCKIASVALMRELHMSKGVSPKNLYFIFSAWKKKGWRELVDYSLENKPNVDKPEEFIDELNRRVDANGRSVEQALKSIHRDWKLGASIPGYGTAREWFARMYPNRKEPRVSFPTPPGWNVRNLRRYVDSSRFRRLAATRGRSAAAMHRPMVLTTRVGLYKRSHLMFDDRWHDRFVNSFAEKQAGRALELCSHDLFFARRLRWGMKIRTEDDNGKASGLTGKMMRLLTAATLYLDGYSPRGTVLVLEHGTAAAGEHVKKVLTDDLGGLVTFSESGMLGKAAHIAQFDGRAGGNPRHKASLESSFNLIHNIEAFLPGATGPDRQRRPEQLHGLLDYNSRLLAAYQQLPPDKAAQLRFPLLELGQYHAILSELYEWLENDPDHDLEGWVQCGHVITEAFLLNDWHNLQALPEAECEMALALIQQGKIATRPRKMSRLEAELASTDPVIRISGGTVCHLLGDDYAAERKVRAHKFIFEDKEVGPGEHQYEGFITDAEGRFTALKDGEIYKAFVNPFAVDQLFVQDVRGRYLGTAKKIARANRLDPHAIREAMGRAAHLEAALLEPLNRRQAKEARAKLAMHRNNAAVMSGTVKDAAKLSTKANRLLAESARTPAPEPSAPLDW